MFWQDASVTVRKASSTTVSGSKNTPKTKAKTLNRGKAAERGKESSGKKADEDMSWFDVDAVYGFGIND